MPGDWTLWSEQGSSTLSPGHPVTLTWDNGQGLVFTRVIGIDDKYMFTIADSVANTSGAAATLYPFAYVAREGVPKVTTSYILHLGFVGVANGSEVDAGYDDFKTRHAAQDLFFHRRLGRHHRQILDGGRHSAPERKLQRRLSGV